MKEDLKHLYENYKINRNYILHDEVHKSYSKQKEKERSRRRKK